MVALKNEFSSILSKSTNVETSLFKTDKVFIILTLIKIGLSLIREQILTYSVIPFFDDVFA